LVYRPEDFAEKKGWNTFANSGYPIYRRVQIFLPVRKNVRSLSARFIRLISLGNDDMLSEFEVFSEFISFLRDTCERTTRFSGFTYSNPDVMHYNGYFRATNEEDHNAVIFADFWINNILDEVWLDEFILRLGAQAHVEYGLDQSTSTFQHVIYITAYDIVSRQLRSRHCVDTGCSCGDV
jgi:hypothetical protein